MISITIPASQKYDPRTSRFLDPDPEVTIVFEHSLKAIALWESIHEKSFFSRTEKTNMEILSYIQCMVINGVDPKECFRMSENDFVKIDSYINRQYTAAKIIDDTPVNPFISVTSENIYYKMFSYGIPIECENWNINRLLALIHVFDVKNAPEKKMSQSEIYAQNRALNEERRKKYNSTG